jgi:hypothetical protein
MTKVETTSPHDGNKNGNNSILLPSDLFRIYEYLTEHHYSASGGNKNIQKVMKYRSRGTVTKKINKLLRLGIIYCVNPADKVKFYKATPGIHVSLVSGNKAIVITGNNLGTVPKNTLVGKKVRRRDKKGRFIKSKQKRVTPVTDYDTVFHEDGQRVKICREHNVSFMAPITGGPVENIKWDKTSSPNGRFTQNGRHDYVPGVGMCYFCWIKSKTKNNLRIWLPEKYVLPHELEQDVLDQVGWKVAKWFSKKYKVGIGILELITDDYAFEATKEQTEFFNNNGVIRVDTVNGKAMIDNSKKPRVEQEYTSRVEAKRVASTLGLPGQIDEVAKKGQSIEDWVRQFTNQFTQFLKNSTEDKLIQRKRWEAQEKFNKIMEDFMKAQFIKNSEYDELLGARARFTAGKQTDLDTFIQKQEEVDTPYQ